MDIFDGGFFDQRDFWPESVSWCFPFLCVVNGRLIDVAEDCLSAEVVEEIFLGISVEFLEGSDIVPFWLGMAN